MRFIETKVFTKRITEYISDDSYRAFQEVLVSNPHSGKVMQADLTDEQKKVLLEVIRELI